MAGPSLSGFVPPDELLALRPGPALGIGRRAVVHDAPVLGPRPRPIAIDRCCVQLIALRTGKVRRLLWEDSAIDPASAGRRAIAGKLGRFAQLTPFAQMIPVYFAQHLLGIGFSIRPAVIARVIPGKVLNRSIPLEA